MAEMIFTPAKPAPSALWRRIRIGLPWAALLVFLFAGWMVRNRLAAERQGNWIAARRGDLVTGFEVSGTLASVETESLGPPPLNDVWEFKLSMLAPEGSDVKKGQPVAAFDTSELKRRLDQKSAEADEAAKQIEKERADLNLGAKNERLRLAEAEARLRKSELKMEAPDDVAGIIERRTTEIEFATAKREAEAIRARIGALERAATARIALLESKRSEAADVVARTSESITRMTCLAPRDGTVVYASNWRGDKKKVGDNVWRAERVVEIPDLTRMKAEGEVDEVDAGRVAVGQRVILRLDSHPDEELHGTITSAGRTVQLKRGTQDPLKVLRVQIGLDKTDPATMRPGMRFQGTIELARAKSALLIPRDAVFVNPEGPFVWRRGLFSSERVPLKLGRENNEKVEVLSGLGPGDRVMVPRTADEEERS